MGKNQNSVVVLQIRVIFWCMIPMGVRDHHTKYEQKTQRWWPGMGFASGGPRFQKLLFRAKNSHFLGQNSPRTHSKRANKGKGWVHSMCALTFLCQRALCGPLTPPYVPETAQKGPHKPQILCRLAGDSHKPRIGHIFGYMAQNAIPRAPNPPTIPHFLWCPPLGIAQMDAYTLVGPVGCGKLQAQAQTGGCPNGSTRSNRGKKMNFLKNDPTPCATLKQVFLNCF